MKTEKEHKCNCGGQLMPLWKNNDWFCVVCRKEQSLPKEKKPLDLWHK